MKTHNFNDVKRWRNVIDRGLHKNTKSLEPFICLVQFDMWHDMAYEGEPFPSGERLEWITVRWYLSGWMSWTFKDPITLQDKPITYTYADWVRDWTPIVRLKKHSIERLQQKLKPCAREKRNALKK